MRSWISFPVGHGVRVGVSGTPVVTRRLTYAEMINDDGKRALLVMSILYTAAFVAWLAFAKPDLTDQWLSLFIGAMVVIWLTKRAVLALFPATLDEIKEASTPDRTQHPSASAD